MAISGKEKSILRELARKVADIGHDPLQEKNRQIWRKHNSLQRVRPLVLVFPEGSWCELLPDSILQCEDAEARQYEFLLRHFIYRWQHLRDDNVIEPRMRVHAVYKQTGWGLEPKRKPSDAGRGAWAYDPVLKDYEDLPKLQKPTIERDEQATQAELDVAHDLFDGTMPVELFRKPGFDTALLTALCNMCGLENLFAYLVEKPDLLHQAMTFMTDATLEMLDHAEEQGYLQPNNQDDYVGSGGVGYTDELPAAGSPENGYTFRDCWGFADAQEFAPVSPQMHYDFLLAYQIRMLDRFGLNCYGCCESLSDKFDIVFKIPRLRRISISPWADVQKSADALGDRYIFSWKPNPAILAGEGFDPELVRSTIKEAVQTAKDCVVEIIMKDTHTVRGEPHRMHEWVRIAKEVAEEGYPS